MILKTYYAIKTEDINYEPKNEYDFINWEVIMIKAYNYYEAASKLKKLKRFSNYHLITNHTLKFRDIIKQ